MISEDGTIKEFAKDFLKDTQPNKEKQNVKTTQSLGKETLEEQKDTDFLDRIEQEQAKQQTEMMNQKDEQENV